jgi:carboxymethylenebutenolidase
MLVQLGVLDSRGLPVAGIETANKLKGEPIPSNALMPTWKKSEGKPG